jgi:putative ABC transport system ATP-binding protein
MNNGLPIIQIRDLRKVYHVGNVEVAALRGLDLDVQPGEFVSLVGPSGSGKSTLFHIIGGLTPPTSGRVRVGDHELGQMTEADRTRLRKQTVAFVFQKFNLLPNLTARDNIAVARYLSGKGQKPDAQFEEVLKLLGIADRLDHKPSALSGGEQQRVAIARAIVNHPAILLADEPTGNLDSRTSVEIMEILGRLNGAGLTIVLVTHEHDISQFAKRTIQFRDGRVRRDEHVVNRQTASEVLKSLPVEKD